MDNSYDVIVVGSGLAGLTAGIVAAENGCRTLILEKMSVIGGTSALSVGGYAVCGSSAQKRAGIKDSHSIFYDDIMECGEGYNIPILVDTLVKNSAKGFKFLKEHGAEYGERLFDVDGHSVKRCFQPVGGLGKNVIEPLTAYFKSLPNTEIFLDTKVTGLILDKGSEEVKGVETDRGDFYGEGGVIFVHGGFERDIFFDKSKPELWGEIPTSTHKGATSETLSMLTSFDAKAYQTEFIRFGTSIAYNDIDKGIIIDIKSGYKLCDGSLSRRVLCEKILKTSQCRYWPIVVFDKDGVSNISNDEKFEAMIISGELQKFNTISSLADFFDIDVSVLSDNIKDKVHNPPFYACVLYLKLNYTQGGVLIDENARIINNKGNPIFGLYGAGEGTGGVHGKVRLTGCSTVDCVVFGMIAGKNAAERAGR